MKNLLLPNELSTFHPLVSIVIPVYNGSNYLGEAIDSALAQTYKNFEILVINDGSNDKGETEKIALSYGEKIRYFHKENGGVASALNLAIREMRGEYFSWLSHDDFYYPQKLEKQLEYIKKNGIEKAILISMYDLFYEDKKELVKFNDKIINKKNMEKSVYAVLEGLVSGCSMLIHRSHFDRVGNFNENLITTQDYDLWFRMFKHQKILYLPDHLTCIRIHSQQGSKVNKLHKYEEDVLWSNFLDQLSERDIILMYNSIYSFYTNYASKMQMLGFQNAYQKALRFLNSHKVLKDGERLFNIFYNFLKGITKNKATKLCIFGTGKFGMKFYSDLKVRNISIDFFCDNDPNKTGKLYYGQKCINFSQLVQEKNYVLVIIAIKDFMAVKEQLAAYKFPYVITYIQVQNKLKKIGLI